MKNKTYNFKKIKDLSKKNISIVYSGTSNHQYFDNSIWFILLPNDLGISFCYNSIILFRPSFWVVNRKVGV